MEQLRRHPCWPSAKLVFLGDLVDRGEDVKGTVQRVIDLLREKPGSVCVCGNHDLALSRAAGLGGEPSEFWVNHYGKNYDHEPTFRSYLNFGVNYYDSGDWVGDLATLQDAMPDEHRRFLAGLPWVAEAAGHLFLHNGLSGELNEPAEAQLHALRQRRWADVVSPKVGSKTAELWQPHYPVWLGADRRVNADPLVVPGKVQVVGHIRVNAPDVNPIRIRLDTTGGASGPLVVAVFRGPLEPPEFVS